MKKTLYYLFPIFLAALFYFSVRYSEEAGKNRIKTKEEALQKVLLAMRQEKPEALHNLCSSKAMQRLKDVLNDQDEFRKLSMSKSIPKSETSSPWAVWKCWAEKIEVKSSMKWEKYYGNQYYPVFSRQDVHLVFDEDGRGWKLNAVIYSVDE